MLRVALLLSLCVPIFAQEPDVTLTEQRSRIPVTTLDFFDSSGNQIYECQAYSQQPPNQNQQFSIAGSTLTNIVVSTNVATATTASNHGLQVGNQVVVTGSATSAVNGTFIIATVPSVTTFTYADTVADGTYTDTNLLLATTAPRTSVAVWSIFKQTFSGSNRTLKQWAVGSSAYRAICDNRAVTTGTTAISYQ